MRSARPWAYKLDYAKEIANDLREIEQAERHVPLAAVLTEAERAKGDYALNLAWFLHNDVEARAPLLGLSPSEVADWGDFCDVVFPVAPSGPGWYSRGQAIDRRLGEQFGEYVLRDPQVLLKKLRSRLARHRRNQEKFG